MRSLLVALMVLAQAPVPVEQEPRHTTRFLDTAMRVLEVRIPPEDTSLEHMHSHDMATVCLECAVTLTRPAGGEWSEPRRRAVASTQITEYTKQPAAHTVRNVDAALSYHLIAVENLRGAGFEIREHDLAPNAPLAPHTHAKPAVMVNVVERTWKVIQPGTPHRVVNGPQARRIVEVELR
jgi:hypothetical protein